MELLVGYLILRIIASSFSNVKIGIAGQCPQIQD
jgi:hypothetical protein